MKTLIEKRYRWELFRDFYGYKEQNFKKECKTHLNACKLEIIKLSFERSNQLKIKFRSSYYGKIQTLLLPYAFWKILLIDRGTCIGKFSI